MEISQYYLHIEDIYSSIYLACTISLLIGIVCGSAATYILPRRKNFRRDYDRLKTTLLFGHRRSDEKGNVFLTIFAGIAMVGILGAATMNFMQGPLKTSTSLTRNNLAQTQLLAAGRLAAASAIQSPAADCDADGLKEPPEWKVVTGAGKFPAGGGHIPDTIGAAKTDPWGTSYGYCGWDHGTKIADAGCGGTGQKRLSGGNTPEGVVISMISAGPDKIFQTICNAGPDYVTKPENSDDIVLNYTLAEMTVLSGNVGGGGPQTGAADCTGLGAAFYNYATSGHCYYTASSTAQWAAAQSVCQGNDAYLAVIGSSGEQSLIESGLNLDSGGKYFIGAKDDLVNTEWRWKGGELDGQMFWQGTGPGAAVGGLYANWRAGYPQATAGYDCAVLDPANAYQWYSGSCGSANRYICEKGGDSGSGGDNLGDHAAGQDLNMSGYKISNVAMPVAASDAAPKAYVDMLAASAGGGGAAPFSFTPLNNVLLDTRQRSNIVQLNGIFGEATAVISGDGGPSYRLCADSGCATVLSDWTTASQKVTDGMWVQLQTTTQYKNSLQITVGLTIGSTTGNWKIRTRASVSPLSFTDLTDQNFPNINSNTAMFQPLGLQNMTFSVTSTGDASYSVRWCYYENCTGTGADYSGYVAQNNTNDLTVPTGGYGYGANYWFVTLRLTNATANSNYDTIFSVNEVSDTWAVSTRKTGYMVMSNGSWNGNLGGLEGADDKCYSDLTANDWKGKDKATALGLLTAGNVKAALCNGTTCNNPTYPGNFSFAVSGSPLIGGTTYSGTADPSSYNRSFGISGDWLASDFFGSTNFQYWSNRGAYNDNYWTTAPYTSNAGFHCTDWALTTGNGAFAQTDRVDSDHDAYKAYYNRVACTTAKRLLCMVQPPP